MDKKQLFQHISETISEKINRLQSDIADLQKDIAEDSKSSAGDKFETSREMAQQELLKLGTQVAEQQRLKSLVEHQSPERSTQAQAGAVVFTDQGIFLLGIPVGKVSFQKMELVGIGLGAPLGQHLLNKQKTDRISFNGRPVTIEEIY